MSILNDLHPEVLVDELKQRHRAMWASGDYPAVVRDVVAPAGPRPVRTIGVSAP